MSTEDKTNIEDYPTIPTDIKAKGYSSFKQLSQKKQLEKEDFLKNNPSGCPHCLNKGFKDKSKTIIFDKYEIEDYIYCDCVEGKKFETKNKEHDKKNREKINNIIRLEKQKERQKKIDIVSSCLSNSFGKKYFDKNQESLPFELKFSSKDNETEQNSKVFFFRALTFIFNNFDKYLNDKGMNMYVYGDSGVGKTHMTVSLYHKIRKELNQYTTMYVVFDEYLNFLKDNFGEKLPTKYQMIKKCNLIDKVDRFLYSCDILFIDEVFLQTKVTDFYCSKLKELLDKRNSESKITIFISNKSLSEAQTTVGATLDGNKAETERIFNRFRENNFFANTDNDFGLNGLKVAGHPVNTPQADTDFLNLMNSLKANTTFIEKEEDVKNEKIDIFKSLGIK